MSRLPILPLDAMDARQRQLHLDIVSGPRGLAASSGGPFAVWMHAPEFGDRVQAFGAFMRYSTSLAPRISELAILACARHWRADYEWFVHAPIAFREGVPEAAIAAIKADEPVDFGEPTANAVYAFSRELLRAGRVARRTYLLALAAVGRKALVELVGVLGYYSLVALTINAFEVDVPADSEILE